ncbi:diguanylate cyclase [Rheinheimera sp. UJ51]|uniref:sensor domain-containing diguanylate cyclase n=1 Tax=unclassified Rheinheimera TaxID=115860 RepID=UPI001E3E3926|nr:MULTISPECIES: sensor domain-containing diguanylate cyclase [unclassified Rheinheimera]MCC5452256.1 diguanylate cyclase [Rheinheimera sp. UJ51]MCF4010924.1 diguanylate cyclase [Rheinheimera sp. UJ63]
MNLSLINAASLINNLHAGVVVHAADTAVLFANPAALKMLRLTETQMIGKDALDPHWHFLDSYRSIMPYEAFPVNRVIATGQPVSNLEVGITDSSSKRVTWVLCNAYPEYDEQQHLSHIVVTFIDTTRSKRNIPFQDVVELASDLVLVLDAKDDIAGGPKIIYANQALTRITGYQKAEVYGQPHTMFDGIDTDPNSRADIAAAMQNRVAVQAQLLNYTKLGEPLWFDLNIVPLCNDVGDVVYFAAIEKDITTLKSKEAQLRELATRDPLTKLLNRRGFTAVAREALKLAERQKSAVTCGMVDIDFFKKINDQYGHEVGDLALSHFASIMRSCFRSSDIISRVGGEEFCILLTECSQADALQLLEYFRVQLAATPLVMHDQQRISITTSIGVSSNDGKHRALLELMKTADQALYQAKSNGRNRTELFSSTKAEEAG